MCGKETKDHFFSTTKNDKKILFFKDFDSFPRFPLL